MDIFLDIEITYVPYGAFVPQGQSSHVIPGSPQIDSVEVDRDRQMEEVYMRRSPTEKEMLMPPITAASVRESRLQSTRKGH